MIKPLNLSLGQLKNAPWQQFELNWFGEPARFKAAFRLALDGQRLGYEFSCPKKPEADLSLATGSFVEGLWNQDVAELFIKLADGSYQEFNLSPTGAWWTATFKDYRERISSSPLKSAQLKSTYDHSHWKAELSFALEEIYSSPADIIEHLEFNVCSILSPTQAEYLCWGHQKGGKPDFHCASCFRKPLKTSS